MNYNMMPDLYNDTPLCNPICPYAMRNTNMYEPQSNANFNTCMNPVRMRTATMEEINDTDSKDTAEVNNTRYKDEKNMEQKVERILMKIEKNNPMLFGRLASFGIPYYAARRIVSRIIYLTLIYSN